MQFSFLAVVYLFGVFQALLFLLGLWRRAAPKSTSLWLLSGLLLSISVILAHHAFYSSVPADWPWRYAFIGPSTAAWLAVPPFFYLYIRSLVETPFRWQPWFRWLFAVPVYYFLTWVIELTGVRIGLYLFFKDVPKLYLYLWITTYLVSATVFALATLKWLPTRPANGRQANRLVWLRQYTLAFLAAIGIAILVFLVLIIQDRYSSQFEMSILLIFEAFVLLIVYQSIRQSAYSGWLANRLYGNSAVARGTLQVLHQRLEAYVQREHPYLRNNLKLSELAAAAGIHENELSQVFTQYLGSNFYTYLNEYRLRAFEQRLLAPDAQRYTISGLATECGFKSKTSLYKAFRAKHGTTPTDFLKVHSQKKLKVNSP